MEYSKETEQRRLSELSNYALVMDESDPDLDRLVQLALKMTDSRLGGLSLVDHANVWLKSRIGVEVSCLQREGAFCAYAVESNFDWFEVADATTDSRFNRNPLVTGDPGVRHYAAATLCSAKGYLIGTLWVMDRRRRKLSEEHILSMKSLAKQVTTLLNLRYRNEITGMSNRATFLHHLGVYLRRPDNNAAMVGFIDLHDFRQFNEIFGRESGNQVLRLMGERLTSWAGGNSLVAHLGGDQFAFSLFGDRENNQIQINLLRNVISAPFSLETVVSYVLHARVGIHYSEHSVNESAAALLDLSDKATTSVSVCGSTVVHEYVAGALTHSRLLSELNRAISGSSQFGSLTVYYQPQVNFGMGCLVGFEALIRWEHPVRGFVPPGDFIPLAEGAGIIHLIDYMVVRQVCAHLRQWLDLGLQPVPVSLNFSLSTLLADDAISILKQELDTHSLPPGLLEIEVTESQMLENSNKAQARVAELRALGIHIAIDDFGTGYSNIDVLTRFEFDRLKADRQFVHGVSKNQHTAGLLRLIQGIATVFNAELLCEGVEDEDDIAWLAQQGATCVQGWYFSKARAAENIPALLAGFQNTTKPDIADMKLLLGSA